MISSEIHALKYTNNTTFNDVKTAPPNLSLSFAVSIEIFTKY